MSNKPNSEILVFGATGGTGAAIVRAALSRQWGITAFVRDSERARQLLNAQSSRLDFFSGDALDENAVRSAVRPDTAAVIVSLGIYQRKSGRDDLARATAHIIAAMRKAGIKRLVCISSIGVGDSRNQGNLMVRLIQKTALRHTLADKELQEQAIRSSGLDWTIIRPSRLLNDGGPPYRYQWTGKQPEGKLEWAISRTQVAELTLDCLDDAQSIHQAINVTGSLTRQ